MGIVLVTGATGNVGREAVKELLAKNQRVRVGVRNIQKAMALLPYDVEFIAFDYNDCATHAAALADVDRLFLVAPGYGEVPVEDMLIPIVDLAGKAGVLHIVFLSGMGADSSEQISLRKVERYIEASNIPHTFLRPNWFMQNFNTFLCDTIKNQNAIYLPVGDALTSFIDVRDIGAVAASVLMDDRHQGKIYTLTGSETLSHHEVAALLSKATTKEVQYFPQSDKEAMEGLTAAGWPTTDAEMMVGLYRDMRAGVTAPVTRDVSVILERSPIKFEQYVEDYKASWQ